MVGEIIPHTDTQRALAQFKEHGHVALSGLYDPSVAPLAVVQADASATVPRARKMGEQIANLRFMPNPKQSPELHAVLEGVRAGALLLNREISPTTPNEKEKIQVIRMTAGTEGAPHVDSGTLEDVVAVTTVEGASSLLFHDSYVSYELTPGIVAIHDLGRALLHQGSALDDGPRVGIAVAKEKRF